MSVQNDYEQIRGLSFTLNGKAIKVISKPGFAGWDSLSPATSLLAENVDLADRSRVLLVGCGHGALAVALSRKNPDCEIWLLDYQYVAIEMAARTLNANGLAGVQYLTDLTALHTFSGKFDVIAMEIPKGRRLAQRLLAESYPALSPEGQLFLAGANNLGIKSIARDAEALLGNGTVLGYKKGYRVVRWIKNYQNLPPPRWMQLPGTSLDSWIEFKVQVRNLNFQLYSLPGVFCSGQMDAGTELLLKNLNVNSSDRMLDLGCGYGLIGLFGANLGAVAVDLVDSNLLAISSARKNIANLHVPNTQAVPSDVLQAVRDRKYTLIVTNPPFHNGREVDYQVTQAFIQQSSAALEPGGRFLLVANRFIPYEKMMAQFFKKIERLDESGKYYVISAGR
jgi:16S rRNA (guanine1207-N2)-methyltransferase